MTNPKSASWYLVINAREENAGLADFSYIRHDVSGWLYECTHLKHTHSELCPFNCIVNTIDTTCTLIILIFDNNNNNFIYFS